MTDLDTIKAALLAFYKLTDSLKYGGLLRQHELAKAALAAVERVERLRLQQRPDNIEELECQSTN